MLPTPVTARRFFPRGPLPAAMAGTEERWSLLGKRKRAAEAPPSQPAPPVEAAPAPPKMRRPGTVVNHWLTLVVARPGPERPVPVAGASIVVRAYPRGAGRPQAVVAQATTGADGSAALLLPFGRYALQARHGDERRAVTITLEHEGRALLLLESARRRVSIQVDASRPDGAPLAEAEVEARAHPSGVLAARTITDPDGVATLTVPPGAYEVRIGDVAVRTYVEADTLLRLTAQPPPRPAVASAPSRYAIRAREALSYAAPFDVHRVRDELSN